MAQQVNERPFGITLLLIYGFIVGLMNIAAGIFVIIDRNDPNLLTESFHSPAQLMTAGIVGIIAGTIQILLASALGHANNVVRAIYAVVAALNLGLGLWATIALHGEQRAAGVFSALFAGLVLYLLFNKKADDYFEQAKK